MRLGWDRGRPTYLDARGRIWRVIGWRRTADGTIQYGGYYEQIGTHP